MTDETRRPSGTLVEENRARHPNRQVKTGPSGRVEEVRSAAPGSYDALARELSRTIRGEVRFDAGSRALYSTDASNYRQVPLGVVVPRTLADVVATMAACRRHGAPVLSRGGGTSLAGEACNVAVVIDFSKYLDRVIEVDPVSRIGSVEPGCVLDRLRDAAEVHHLTFGPDPATHDHNTLGGMIGNNSGGVHAVMAGITVHNVESLDVLTYDGVRMTVGPTSETELEAILAAGGRRAEIYGALDRFRKRYGDLIRARFPDIPRRVSGYSNLDQLLPEKGFNVARALVGTEGTLVTILGARLNLVDSPRVKALAIIGFPDVFEAADAVPEVLKHGPIACEGLDQYLIDNMKTKSLHTEHLGVLPEGSGWLMVEFGGDTVEEAGAKADRLVEAFEGRTGISARTLGEADEIERMWKIRESGLGATAYVPGQPDTWEGWEDTAVHRDRLGDYLRELKALFHKFGYDSTFYGHFGDGLVHCRINFDLRSEAGVATWRRFLDEAADLVVRYDGSLSGEHGDGQARAALLGKMYGPELIEAFRAFKAIFDPDWKMNPGKVVDPYPITSNLRIGPDYVAPDLATVFSFADDGGSFAHASRRCVGVGKCRRADPEDGVMCPSFQATREEKHSTRGRSRLLFEMVHGGPIDDGWKSREVEDALSLCLACKGCKSDCPVNVDMATYKAEFRAHHYKGRLRPRSAYSMGLIYWWSKLASRLPRLANGVFATPGLSRAAKWIGGIAPERQMPRFADQTFTDWFARRTDRRTTGPRVILWPDTFNTAFRPQTAIAATLVLEAAGYQVSIPRRRLCCGRPLYDWGMLDAARRLWRQTMDTLREDIKAGVPVIGLEPACTASFRDELPGLFPGDGLAERLARQTHQFSAFIEEQNPEIAMRPGRRAALVQMHCHHHAVLGTDPERALLERIGVDHEMVSGGCCGMAGSFGFDADKYDLSMTIAEQGVLPKVRAADPDTVILADGFSCREQIEQGTGRRTVHIAELMAERMGLSVDR